MKLEASSEKIELEGKKVSKASSHHQTREREQESARVRQRERERVCVRERERERELSYHAGTRRPRGIKRSFHSMSLSKRNNILRNDEDKTKIEHI